jgi:DME family drug/metabolite transporter
VFAPTRPAPAHRAAGHLHVLLAACLWGTTGTVRTFVPAASNLSIAAMRITLGGAVLLAARRRAAPMPSEPVLLLLGAAAIITYQTAFFVAADRTGVAIGTAVTIGSAPAVAGLLGAVRQRAWPPARFVVATAGAVAGCVVLVGGGHAGGADPVGIGLAVLSGSAYAVYTTVVSALLGRGHDGRTVTAALFGLAALVMAPTLLSGAAGWVVTARGLPIAVYLGAVTTAGGYLLLARGLRTTPPATATTLTLLEPAVAALLGWLVLHEHLGPTVLAGQALIAASLAVLVSGGSSGSSRRTRR